MRIQEIIDRLNDMAKELDQNPKHVREVALFLRATAKRIASDVELEAKIALVKAEFDAQVALVELRHAIGELQESRPAVTPPGPSAPA